MTLRQQSCKSASKIIGIRNQITLNIGNWFISEHAWNKRGVLFFFFNKCLISFKWILIAWVRRNTGYVCKWMCLCKDSWTRAIIFKIIYNNIFCWLCLCEHLLLHSKEIAEGRRSSILENFSIWLLSSLIFPILPYSKGYIQSVIVIATFFGVVVSLSGR